MTITVTAREVPAQVLTVNTPTSWQVPVYSDETESLSSVSANMNPSLQAFITYDSSANEFLFSGDELSAQLAN